MPTGCIILADDDDLAVIHLPSRPKASPFSTTNEFSILDEVITIGYPPVVMVGSYQLVHKGEVNAVVKDYTDKKEYIIFSAKTQPGHSGGPIIDDAGLVVGVVTQDFANQQLLDSFGLSYFAAIPCDRLAKFVNTRALPQLVSDGHMG